MNETQQRIFEHEQTPYALFFFTFDNKDVNRPCYCSDKDNLN